MAVAVARSNLMFGTASTLSPPKIRAKRPASAFEMGANMLGRNGFPKAGDGGLKLEVTAQALVRHAPVEDQHGDMTFFRKPA